MHTHLPSLRARRAGRLLWALSLAATAAQANSAQPQGSLRLFRETASANSISFGQLARSLDSGIVSPGKSFTGSELTLGLSQGGLKLNSSILVLGNGDRPGGSRARISEAYLTHKVGAWQFGGGRRVLDWGVGFGFRPNDLVMEEATRPLSPTARQGKYLLQVDHYGPGVTTSLALLNPHRLGTLSAQRRLDEEAAAVGQVYGKAGDLDVYGFGRYGKRTGSSAGMGLVGVPTDAITLQGSFRVLRAYSGLTSSGAVDALALQSPWVRETRGNVPLVTLGASWAGEAKQSVFVEYWHDARALSDKQWSQWQQRGQWLAQTGNAFRGGFLPEVPANLLAGNFAWQEIPLEGLNQRRDSVLIRLAWQPENYAFTFDTVLSPTDGGRIHTLSAQWRRYELQLNAAVRWLAGPQDAVSRQLPTSTEGLLSVSWGF